MQFTIATVFALAAAVSAVPASPRSDTIAAGDAFGLVVLRSGSALQYQSIQASSNGFFSGLSGQNASCATDGVTAATFTIGTDGSLNLYSTSAPYQKAYADDSGMGQGVFQYTTGAEEPSGQTTSFSLDASNDLSFNNLTFLACPYLSGSYSYHVNVGVAEPEGISGCVDVSLRAVKTTSPVSCLYTE